MNIRYFRTLIKLDRYDSVIEEKIINKVLYILKILIQMGTSICKMSIFSLSVLVSKN